MAITLAAVAIYLARAPSEVSIPDTDAAAGAAAKPTVSVVQPVATRAAREVRTTEVVAVTAEQARVDRGRNDVKRAEIDLRRTTIALPFAGRVRGSDIHKGQIVARPRCWRRAGGAGRSRNGALLAGGFGAVPGESGAVGNVGLRAT